MWLSHACHEPHKLFNTKFHTRFFFSFKPRRSCEDFMFSNNAYVHQSVYLYVCQSWYVIAYGSLHNSARRFHYCPLILVTEGSRGHTSTLTLVHSNRHTGVLSDLAPDFVTTDFLPVDYNHPCASRIWGGLWIRKLVSHLLFFLNKEYI